MTTIINNIPKPCIYLRYLNGELCYIGESANELNGRPYRNEKHDSWDKCKILKASSNNERRKYWEAWLIVKLKPKRQSVKQYSSVLSKLSNDEQILTPNSQPIRQKVKKEKKIKDLKYLEELRAKNNKERAMYWLKQALTCCQWIELNRKKNTVLSDHVKVSIKMYQSFKKDSELQKKELEGKG